MNDKYANFDDILFQSKLNQLNAEKPEKSPTNFWLRFNFLYFGIIVYITFLLTFTRFATLIDECEIYGICTITKISDNPYRIYYKNNCNEHKILFNPENDYYFGDDLVVENSKFRFYPYLLVFKRIEKLK